MKTTTNKLAKAGSRTVLFGLVPLLCVWNPLAAGAQPRIIGPSGPVISPGGPMPMPPGEPPSSSHSESGAKGNAWIPSEPPETHNGTNDQIQLSFQGANIDLLVQWLAQTTGKTVIKSPKVQCQVTIASPKKVGTREAITLVYRALALEGYAVVESAQSILIVPKDEQPRMSPRLVTGLPGEIPPGRERLMKIFTLKHVQAAQIQGRIQAALSDAGTVELDPTANQIIVTDFNDNLRVAGDLIAALDKDKPEDVAIRAVALKHMSAQDLAKELTPMYQKMTSKTPQEMVDVAADDRSNTLIVLSGQATFNALERIIGELDTEGAQDKVMQTFVLENADAQDVAKQLHDLSEGPSDNSRYPFYIFGGSSSGQNESKRISVAADRRRNAVIVQAPPAQMDSIAQMIEELDAPVPGDSLSPKIYHLKYVSASDVEDVLNELFAKKRQSRSYWDYYFGDSEDSSSNTQDAGRLYGKVRITSEPIPTPLSSPPIRRRIWPSSKMS